MSVEDEECVVPIPATLGEGIPLLKAGTRRGSFPSLSELDLYATAAAGMCAASAWFGDAGEGRCTVRDFVDDSGLHLQRLPLAKENPYDQGGAEAETFFALSVLESKDATTGKPKQCQTSEVAASRTTSRGRYARSETGWASKERSTPEGYNRENHAWQFEPPFSQGMSAESLIDAYIDAFEAPDVVRPPKIKKSPEERKAIREKKIVQSERASLRHVETALRKYNRANNTMFVLDELTVKCLFFEFGGPCFHYNFTAKLENHHSAGGSVKLFFSEINCPLRSEDDVLVCCIIGEEDAGHCHACKDYRPMMVHPSSRAYGGGNTSVIDYPNEDSSSSDSDY